MTKKVLILTALCLTLAAPAALAGATACSMEATPKGFEVDAQGKAQLSDGRSESLVVKMAARLDDGSVLIVTAGMRNGEKVDLGSFSMLLGAGEFSLNSARDRYSKAFPMSEISTLSVSMRGTPLLEGVCGGGDGDARR